MAYLRVYQLIRYEKTCRDTAHVFFYLRIHNICKLVMHGRFEIEIRKILPVVPDLDARSDVRALCSAARKRFKKRAFADPVRTRELQMLILAQRQDFLAHHDLMVPYSFVRRDTEHLAR